MPRFLADLLRDDRGQDLIEYGLLAAVISLAGTATIITLGEAIDGLYAEMPAKLP